MNILFIGDIVGRPGREAVKKALAGLREREKIDFVIANAENAHHGKGISPDNITDLKSYGVDFFTAGNHIWKERTIIPLMGDRNYPLVRPANYPEGVPGRGWAVVETADKKRILVINLLGRLYMNVNADCPFRTADRILKETAGESPDAIFVDFHAEATSEKVALGYHLAGRVTAVIGTHAHVATADARILPNGTAYQTDAGFVGPLDSVIGVKKEIIIGHFLTQMPVKHELADGPALFNAVKIVTGGAGKALSIETIKEIVE